MSTVKERMVVVSYDAAANSFSVSPNPVSFKPGVHTLYLALRTVNRGDADEAIFKAVYEDNLITSAKRVGTCDQLWQVTINNEPAVTEDTAYSYTVRVEYAGSEYAKDPSVVLQPPPPP